MTDLNLLLELQDFLLLHVLQDATSIAHHDKAGSLYARTHMYVTRSRPALVHFLLWRNGPENSVRENPKAEIMVYSALFPGRIHDLLLELLS